MKKIKKTERFIIILFLLLQICSCNINERYVNEYSQTQNPTLLILSTPTVEYKYCLPEGNGYYETFARKKFPYRLQHFMENKADTSNVIFENSIKKELQLRNYTIFDENNISDFFAQSQNNRFILEILQIHCEEYAVPFTDSVVTPDNIWFSDTVFTEIQYHFWLRLNPLDDTSLAAPILYFTQSVSDYLTNNWEYNKTLEEFFHTYTIEAIYDENVLALLSASAITFGEYLDDYFLNMYIRRKSKNKVDKYYTISEGKLQATKDNRFIFMKGD